MARKVRSERREAKRFAFILGGLLLGFAALASWRNHDVRAAICAGAAVVVVVLALVLPTLWLRAFRIWMRFADGMSWVMTRVILTVFFYVILSPIGLFLRIIRKDLLDLAWKDGRSTYWIEKIEPEYTLDRYEKQY